MVTELKNARIQNIQKMAKNFFKDLAEGRFNDFTLEINDALIQLLENEESVEELKRNNELYSAELNLKEDAIIDSGAYFAFDPNLQTLFIKNVPKEFPRKTLEDELMKCEGFVCLSLCDPLRTHNYVRFGWAIFTEEKYTTAALEALSKDIIENHSLNIVKNHKQRRFLKILPNLTPKRLQEHLQFSKDLIEVLDKTKDITENALLSNSQKDADLKQFDLQVLYLRKVHSYCYFSAAVSPLLTARSIQMKGP